MWENFFKAGGWGMYPVMAFGFALLAAVTQEALRKEARPSRVANPLRIMTGCAGLLGTLVGICTSAHYIDKVPPDKQLQILAFGTEESLHDLVLALIIVLIAGMISIAGTLRRRSELASVP
jgi:hypothetical protein